MNKAIITIDLDWACEAAIEETLDFFKNLNIFPTVFITHRSPRVESDMKDLEVGLHPYFSPDSSHGSTICEVADHVMSLPHNLPAFRCHRFAISNESKKAMMDAGMLISSNVCTDLEIMPPFKDRFGLLEVPIFLEDGGYLWRKHSLELNQNLINSVAGEGIKVILIHPMHFSLNTPHFSYMYDIKQSLSRNEWNNLTSKNLNKLRWNGRGIRDLMIDLLKLIPGFTSLRSLIAAP